MSTFFFYDLETSGFNPRSARIMQFAGQRTDEKLQPIGEPYNILIKISEDVLPEPDAILVTGITPQKTHAEGVTEAEFAKIFVSDISKPGTIFTGFNNIRFDDEFLRFLLYRNFYDPYSWHWQDDRSRWDLLDVVRMTRALRPNGINWPFDSDGRPANRLEFITKANKLDHGSAHDALSDVHATIAVARMIRDHQPKLFNYLYSMRSKQEVSKLISSRKPFVYSSGKYPAEFEKTSIVLSLGEHPDKQGDLVYDLRSDPSQFINLEPKELAKLWQYDKDKKITPLPIKALQFNRCPAVAPLSVLDKASLERLSLDMDLINKHYKSLQKERGFIDNLHEALSILNAQRVKQTAMIADERQVDAQLYDGFIPDKDKSHSERVHKTEPEKLSFLADGFSDERLKKLLPLYKARNFQKYLTDEERQNWEEHLRGVLLSGGEQSVAAKFSKRLAALISEPKLSGQRRYILEELNLYAQSILPEF